MQLGRSLTTQCLEQAHRGACHRSTIFSTFAQSTSKSVLRSHADATIRNSIHHRCAHLSVTAYSSLRATPSTPRRYRPQRPRFRKIFQNQEVLPWTQDAGRGIENSQVSEDSGGRVPQQSIELLSGFVDAFNIRKNSVQVVSHALETGTKPGLKQIRSEDGAEHEQTSRSSAKAQISFPETTTEELEEELQWIARNEPNTTDIKTILTILVQDRQIKPAPKHYEALILANCNPEEGSSENVAAVLEEMETDGVDIDAGIYVAALNAIAIHPSLPLTWSILSSMQTRWITQTPQMTHALITIFVRTSQLELANDLLNEIHKVNKPLPRNQRTPIPKYLYILLIRALVEKKDYEAVMRWLYRLHDRKAMEMDMPADFWGWVLEQAARDGDGWVTGWLWQDWVEKMKVRPQRKTCSDVMQIAARDGVAWLAESVKDVIRHEGFMEASRSELTMDEDWINGQRGDNDTSTTRSSFNSHRTDIKRNASTSHDMDHDRFSSNNRASLSPHLPEIKTKSKRKPTKGTSSKDTSDLSHLTAEEESLLDQAYRNCDLNVNKKRGYKDLSNLTTGERDNVNLVNGAVIGDSGGGGREGKFQRSDQIKPGNLWPWFKNIEGYGNPRFDPWKALGPKSRS